MRRSWPDCRSTKGARRWRAAVMEMEAGAIMLEMPTVARFCSDLAPATLARMSAPPMGSVGWLDWDWDGRDDLGTAPTPGVGGTSHARGPGTVWARWVGRVSSLTSASASARDKTLTL